MKGQNLSPLGTLKGTFILRRLIEVLFVVVLHSVLRVACDKEPSLPWGGPVRVGKPHLHMCRLSLLMLKTTEGERKEEEPSSCYLVGKEGERR